MADASKVGILVFDDVEELDFVGPLEVFGMACRFRQRGEVRTVASESREVRCRYGLQVTAHELITDSSAFDVLIVPGGLGARPHAANSKPILEFIQRQRGIVASVCTGSLVLAAAGVLQGIEATTHHSAYETLQAYHGILVREGHRVTKSARIWTAAGISAGIDLSLALVSHLWGTDIAERIASNMEWEHAGGWRVGT